MSLVLLLGGHRSLATERVLLEWRVARNAQNTSFDSFVQRVARCGQLFVVSLIPMLRPFRTRAD